jgi:hypothetical protein
MPTNIKIIEIMMRLSPDFKINEHSLSPQLKDEARFKAYFKKNNINKTGLNSCHLCRETANSFNLITNYGLGVSE